MNTGSVPARKTKKQPCQWRTKELKHLCISPRLIDLEKLNTKRATYLTIEVTSHLLHQASMVTRNKSLFVLENTTLRLILPPGLSLG
jgi:hypothetical protein